MQWLRTIVLLGIVLALVFAGWSFRAGNAGVIDLDLVWLRVPNVQIWWALVVALAGGAGLGLLVAGFAWLRQRILNRRYRKEIARLESEVHQLRSLPLAGGVGAVRDDPVGRFSIGRG